MRQRAVALLVAATCAAPATPAMAADGDATDAATATRSCQNAEPSSWQAFAAWDDFADYWLAPGGDFEDSAEGWKLSGARIVAGNETAGVLDGDRSLALGSGLLSGVSTAVTPPFCVDTSHPTFRYLLKANGAVGELSTFIRFRDVDGTMQEEQVRSRTQTTLLPGRWKPSDLQPLATRLPMAALGGSARVQLVFRTPISALGSGYQIDNVLVDPYRTR